MTVNTKKEIFQTANVLKTVLDPDLEDRGWYAVIIEWRAWC